MHLSYLSEAKCPFRNILLRDLVNKLFEISNQTRGSDQFEYNDYTELAANLFNSNLSLTSNDIAAHKGKFKNFKNTLAEFSTRKVSKKVRYNKKIYYV